MQLNIQCQQTQKFLSYSKLGNYQLRSFKELDINEAFKLCKEYFSYFMTENKNIAIIKGRDYYKHILYLFYLKFAFFKQNRAPKQRCPSRIKNYYFAQLYYKFQMY